jgi:hypothetical protein
MNLQNTRNMQNAQNYYKSNCVGIFTAPSENHDPRSGNLTRIRSKFLISRLQYAPVGVHLSRASRLSKSRISLISVCAFHLESFLISAGHKITGQIIYRYILMCIH